VSDADEAPEVPAEKAAADKAVAKPSRADRRLERRADKSQKLGVFARVALFLRQVVAELRKVIWPTRKELIQYTWVVLIFVLVMGAYIGVLDFGFAKAVLAVFG
jgi:preprotein translocase subunit SecE